MKRDELEGLEKPALLEAAQQLFDQLQTANADVAGAEEKHSTEISALKAAHATELSEVENIAKENEETLNETITDLRGKLTATKKEVSVQKKTVKCDGKEYEVKLPIFRHKGITYKAEDLQSESEVVKELIEMEAAVLEEIIK